jgi:hypothetical protein
MIIKLNPGEDQDHGAGNTIQAEARRYQYLEDTLKYCKGFNSNIKILLKKLQDSGCVC